MMKYQQFTELYQKGRLSMIVNRSMARKFYTHIPAPLIKKETGESPYFEKLTIWLSYLLSPVTLLASIALGFMTFGCWGFLSLFGSLSIYGLFASASLKSRSRLLDISLLFIVTVMIHIYSDPDHFEMTRFACLFLLSLWCIRFAYWASGYFLKAFVLRNEKAYSYLSKYLVINRLDAE
ncbi:hypothetical protein JW835_09415 [bacterium]|nr:hypothetical protein [bacterium]